MSKRVFAFSLVVLFAALMLVAPASADDFLIGGGVSLSHDNDHAQVQANTKTTSGSHAQPAGDYAAPAQEGSSYNPWDRYTLVTDPETGDQQLCLTVNAGLPDASGGRTTVCYDVVVPDAADGPVAIDPAALAAQAVARLSVPAPAISIGPHPSDNKWGVLAVGQPIWVWADDPGPVVTTVSEQGIDIEMQATRGPVTFDWGDGSSSVCHQMRSRPVNIDPLIPSPDCGHSYLSRGDYTVTASAGWAVSWRALGQSGTLPLNSSSDLTVPIREFRSLVVG